MMLRIMNILTSIQYYGCLKIKFLKKTSAYYVATFVPEVCSLESDSAPLLWVGKFIQELRLDAAYVGRLE